MQENFLNQKHTVFLGGVGAGKHCVSFYQKDTVSSPQDEEELVTARGTPMPPARLFRDIDCSLANLIRRDQKDSDPRSCEESLQPDISISEFYYSRTGEKKNNINS